MNRNILIVLLVLPALIAISACNSEYRKYNVITRKGTLAEKDSAAFYFYQVRKDYEKASFLFEELRNAYRGTERGKDMLYYYADCKYQTAFYVLAAYYYEQYASQYPSDPRTEECVFKVGYCYYLQAAPHYLDQEFTRKTIDQFQLFINAYPYSDKVEDCNSLMNEMRERLALKEFESAKLYYQLESYKAAVTSFEVMIQEFPDSRYREEAQFLLFKSAANLGDKSIQNKKKNRYLDALEYYESFVDKYPNSVYLREAENLYAKTKKNLGKLQAEEAENNSR